MSENRLNEDDLHLFLETAEAAGHSIYITGVDGTIEYVNPAFEEITGFSADEAVGQTPNILKSGEHDREFYEELWDTILAGDVWRDEIVNKRRDGARYVADQTIAPITDDGEVTKFVAINVDITRRKARERQLERFRNAVEHAGHGVLITDSRGTIQYVNSAFEETTGYSAAEAIGEDPSLLNSGEHDEGTFRELWETILDGEVWQGELINQRKNGSRYVVDQTISPLTENGKIEGFVAINRDVTRLKKYRREIEKQNERLAEYGQTVAHDLRNPLGVLKAELEQLRATATEADDDDLVGHCENVAEVTEQMESLIDDFLTMAEQGQLVVDPVEISLQAVAEDAWEQTAAAGTTPWELDHPDATLSVQDTELTADPERVMQLLVNLFRNAHEHGGESVSVRVGPLDFERGFYVEDDGPGIPEDQREAVFERGMTTSDDGTGFGLSIVEQIARSHGWDVTVTEGTESGARFEFRPERDHAVVETTDTA
ncbi:PAS domain-containing sensor histidine kinase [Halovenus salina]|nr:PAS domain S-box protein [Halovenus salina]